ncbi:MAG: lipopolysaccharide biosynthesis protein [Dysgonamonadaceae bacterium]|jgi:PST family polysaccharide transporter|nr:lipopolysaccharide biosynthesis protein [Dysgonamonadaceae bacterium]
MSNLKNVFIGGVFYTALAKYSGVVIGLVVTAVLSRILLPGEFGIIAVAMVFIAFFSILSDVGIGTAIIQKKELTETDLSHIFSLTLYLAGISAIVFFFASAPIASYYGEPALAVICKILSVHLFFAVANIVPNGLLLKHKAFKFIALRTLIVQLAGGTLAVGAALRGFGIYALLVAPVFSSVTIFIINYSKFRLPFSPVVRRSAVRKIFSYSVFQFLFNVIHFFSRNLDNLLIGKYLGLSPLGYYEKSYRLMLLPMSNISYILVSVIHPVFSDYQNNIRYVATQYLKVVKLLAMVGFPLSAFLFFTAQEWILLLFGDQWMPSVPVFRCLCLSVGFQMVVSSAGAIFQTANATKYLFIDGLLSTLFTVLCLFTGLFVIRELNATALLISLSFMLNFFKSFFILFRFVLKESLLLFFKPLVMPVLLSILLAGILYGCCPFLHLPLLGSLAVKTAIAGAVVLGFIRFFNIYDWSVLLKYGNKTR